MEKNIKDFWSNCSFLMRLLSLTIILALVMPVLTNAQAGKTNFAGTWALNAEKSTQPQGGGGGGGGGRGGFGGGLGNNFVATMDANSLTVVTTRTGQDGATSTRTSKYILDGKENVLTTTGGAGGGGGGGGTPPKYVAKWSADGKSLTIATTRTFNENTMTSTAVWSLSDAKTLSVQNTSPGRDGGAERKTTMVYDKK